MAGYAVTNAVDTQFTDGVIDPVGLPDVDESGLLQVEPVINHVYEDQPVRCYTLDHVTSLRLWAPHPAPRAYADLLTLTQTGS
jgi:hypothetical protein